MHQWTSGLEPIGSRHLHTCTRCKIRPCHHHYFFPFFFFLLGVFLGVFLPLPEGVLVALLSTPPGPEPAPSSSSSSSPLPFSASLASDALDWAVFALCMDGASAPFAGEFEVDGVFAFKGELLFDAAAEGVEDKRGGVAAPALLGVTGALLGVPLAFTAPAAAAAGESVLPGTVCFDGVPAVEAEVGGGRGVAGLLGGICAFWRLAGSDRFLGLLAAMPTIGGGAYALGWPPYRAPEDKPPATHRGEKRERGGGKRASSA